MVEFAGVDCGCGAQFFGCDWFVAGLVCGVAFAQTAFGETFVWLGAQLDFGGAGECGVVTGGGWCDRVGSAASIERAADVCDDAGDVDCDRGHRDQRVHGVAFHARQPERSQCAWRVFAHGGGCSGVGGRGGELHRVVLA
jgi:hypothetical protein